MMKLKFLAGAGPDRYKISGSFINGIDTAQFVEGSNFTGNTATMNAGIFGMQWANGVLHVALAQPCIEYEAASETGANDWIEGDWIDADDYDPERCYIVATSAPDGAEYVKRDDGWTVVLPETEEPTA